MSEVIGEWWRNLENEIREIMDRPIDHYVFINEPQETTMSKELISVSVSPGPLGKGRRYTLQVGNTTIKLSEHQARFIEKVLWDVIPDIDEPATHRIDADGRCVGCAQGEETDNA